MHKAKHSNRISDAIHTNIDKVKKDDVKCEKNTTKYFKRTQLSFNAQSSIVFYRPSPFFYVKMIDPLISDSDEIGTIKN